MRASPDGLPETGDTGRSLGARPRIDITHFDREGRVRPGYGGMSVAPDDPGHLPRSRRPQALGGTGIDPVWYIKEGELGPRLQFRQDGPRHGVVEPADRMTGAEYQKAIWDTRPNWKMLSDDRR